MNRPLALLEKSDVRVVERLDMPARRETCVPVPSAIANGAIGTWLSRMLGTSSLWAHQALAIEAAASGQNLVVATATASGKTLPFMATAMLHLLASDGVVLAFYTSKALASDQLPRWCQAIEAAGLPETAVAQLTGNVPQAERIDALTKARVIIATPDVWQAWAMSQVSSPLMRTFLARLSLVILDEAHCYEHIFGSNQAYLLRRLRAACARAASARGARPLHFMAATATIADPAGHLERLTGLPFTAIGDDQNGAPRARSTLLHIEGPDHGAPAEAFVVNLLEHLIPRLGQDTIIVFDDSRQRVERIARMLGRDDVFAYRSGYEDSDRKRIEAALRAGRCRAIISTSALELGIDIPHFVIGLLVGLPPTKKQFRQRVGRVGRASPGVCALIAPPTVFSQFGSSLADYWQSSVEPSHLYLDNPFIQFGQARCLIDECEALQGKPQLPSAISWPTGFADTFEHARPGAPRARMFDAVAAIGADSPHYNFPLRQIGETRFELRSAGGDPAPFGTISHQQALREAYPGATYLHAGRCYRVKEWRTATHDRSIRLEPVKHGPRTDALIYKAVNLSVGDEGVVEGRFMSGEHGVLAEIELQVSEAVEGYRVGNTSLLYRDLRQTNPAMNRKQFEFSTTGVLLQIEEPWFNGTTQTALNNRRAVGRALRHLLMHERSISGSEVDFADSNIAWWQSQGPRRRNDCLVIYDCVYGGLRLTESLFATFPSYLEQLARAGILIGSEAMLSSTLVDRLSSWFETLKAASARELPKLSIGKQGDEYLIFAPNSEVAIMHNGVLSARTLGDPQIMSIGDGDLLMYRYDAGSGGSGYVAHDRIHPVGHNWRHALWDPRTNTVRELDQ